MMRMCEYCQLLCDIRKLWQRPMRESDGARLSRAMREEDTLPANVS